MKVDERAAAHRKKIDKPWRLSLHHQPSIPSPLEAIAGLVSCGSVDHWLETAAGRY